MHANRVWLFATPRTVAHQAPLSIGLARQEYWSELFPAPRDLANPVTETFLHLLHWQVGSLPAKAQIHLLIWQCSPAGHRPAGIHSREWGTGRGRVHTVLYLLKPVDSRHFYFFFPFFHGILNPQPAALSLALLKTVDNITFFFFFFSPFFLRVCCHFCISWLCFSHTPQK